MYMKHINKTSEQNNKALRSALTAALRWMWMWWNDYRQVAPNNKMIDAIQNERLVMFKEKQTDGGWQVKRMQEKSYYSRLILSELGISNKL